MPDYGKVKTVIAAAAFASALAGCVADSDEAASAAPAGTGRLFQDVCMADGIAARCRDSVRAALGSQNTVWLDHCEKEAYSATVLRESEIPEWALGRDDEDGCFRPATGGLP